MRWVKASDELPDEGTVSAVKILHGITRIKHAEYFGLINDKPVWNTISDENGYSFRLYSVLEWLDEPIPTQSGEDVESQIQKQYAEKGNKLGEIVGTLPDLLTTPGESMEDLIKENYSCVCAEIYTRRDMVDPDCVYHEHGDTIKELMQRWASIQCKERDAEIEQLKAWKESASDILNTIDLQECSKYLKLQPGSDIAKYILPALQSLSTKEAAIKELVSALNDWEQWEADLISDNNLWWPYKEKDAIHGETYTKMLELQDKRKQLITKHKPTTP